MVNATRGVNSRLSAPLRSLPNDRFPAASSWPDRCSLSLGHRVGGHGVEPAARDGSQLDPVANSVHVCARRPTAELDLRGSPMLPLRSDSPLDDRGSFPCGTVSCLRTAPSRPRISSSPPPRLPTISWLGRWRLTACRSGPRRLVRDAGQSVRLALVIEAPDSRHSHADGPGLSIAALCVASCDEVAVGAVDEIHRRVALGELREPDGFADSDQVSWLRDLAPASIRTHPRAQRAGTSPSRTARTESSSHPTSRHNHPCRALTPNAQPGAQKLLVKASAGTRRSSGNHNNRTDGANRHLVRFARSRGECPLRKVRRTLVCATRRRVRRGPSARRRRRPARRSVVDRSKDAAGRARRVCREFWSR
jgi:hypothetical protein